jgi:hypothetical protein
VANCKICELRDRCHNRELVWGYDAKNKVVGTVKCPTNKGGLEETGTSGGAGAGGVAEGLRGDSRPGNGKDKEF